MGRIRKILVANRGEIAVRVMRTAREMGIGTVAVYSDVDRLMPHATYADEAVHIGAPQASASYLNGSKIIQAAKETGADAIHPGYGFLSENEHFAKEVEKAGLTFIGPSPAAILTMGDKLMAKKAVAKFDVPLVPGTTDPIANAKDGKKVARDIGYPILIKASAGGGGKGMRVVEKESEFEEQMQRAMSEAKAAFGSADVFIEKYVNQPRHIEFQVFGDRHGNAVHLFERECSIQRRHQKVIEEAPSSVLTEELRQKMGKAAINVVRSCAYVNAGTVEFIVDKDLNFYFLEMNTRLQVEHPVTEMITGLDLVRLQIRIAEGEAIPFRQEDLRINGHAIESRVYAEDPANNFLPDTGTLKRYRRPGGQGVRIDDGIEEGMNVPFYYDPMIAKLVAHGENRQSAIDKMVRAIDDYSITGVQTTLPFCRFAILHEAFRSGNFDTRFVENYFRPELMSAAPREDEEQIAAALAVQLLSSNGKSSNHVAAGAKIASGWKHNRRESN